MVLLSNLKEALVLVLSAGTWDAIEARFRIVELNWREDLEPRFGKPKYVHRVLEALSDEEVVEAARRCVTALSTENTIGVENALWDVDSGGKREISRITREALAASFEGQLLHPRADTGNFMARFQPPTARPLHAGDVTLSHTGKVLVATSSPLAGHRSTQFERTTERVAITYQDLFEYLGFFDWPDRRVIAFLEALIHPETRRGDDQSAWVGRVADCLAADGFTVVQADRVSGHPVYRVRSRSPGVSGKPKNLIFASTGPKPELGFIDAVNNGIRILKHEEHCLVYDGDLPDSGLLWEDLVGWWIESQSRELTREAARR
jgi:hypothetical protein